MKVNRPIPCLCLTEVDRGGGAGAGGGRGRGELAAKGEPTQRSKKLCRWHVQTVASL